MLSVYIFYANKITSLKLGLSER